MANFSPKPSSSLPLPLAILAFALFFLPASHSLSNNVEWPPVPLGPKDGKSGNLSDWTQWTTVKYMVTDQCLQQPGGDKVPDSYRLLFHCNNGEECVGAKYFVCYPSMLDPEALPDESNTSGVAPMRRALSQKWLTNSANNEITKKCQDMVEQCKADMGVGGCWKEVPEMAKYGVEVWHGFSVTREKGKFLVKMPFGDFKVPDKDEKNPLPDDGENPPHFYINFGDANDAERSFVSKSIISNRKGQVEKIHKIKDQRNQAFYNLYLAYRAQGIPLDKVAHLWTLGVDILRDEEQQKIRFITKGVQGESEKEECQMSGNETGLVKSGQSTKYKYIVATYLRPNTKNSVINVGKDANRIDVSKEPKKIYYEPLEDLYTGFFFHVYIPPDAKAFKISLVKGRQEPTAYLGKVILELSAKFLNDSEKRECTLNVLSRDLFCEEAKNVIINTGNSFWFWMDTKVWNISMNCTAKKFTSDQPKIPFSSVSFLKFEGDMELYKIVDGKTAVLKSKKPVFYFILIFILYNYYILLIPPKDVENLLSIRDISMGLIKGDYLSIYMETSNSFGQIEIKLVEHDKAKIGQDDELIIMFTIANKVDCPALGECIKYECTYEECKNMFNLIIFHNNPDGIMLFINGNFGKISPNIKMDYTKEHFLQIHGDIKIIKDVDHTFLVKPFRKVDDWGQLNKKEEMFNDNDLDKRDFVNVHCMALEYSKGDHIHFGIFLSCRPNGKECKLGTKLEINFDFNQQWIKAFANEWDFNSQSEIGSDKFPLALGMPFWVKIGVDAENNYNIYFNGNLSMTLPCCKDDIKHVIKVEKVLIQVSDFHSHSEMKDFLVLDKIFPFPMRIPLLNDQSFSKFMIDVQVQAEILPHGKFFELFLAKDSGIEGEYMKLGTREQRDFNASIFMHVWVKFNVNGKDKICLSTNTTINMQETESCDGGKLLKENIKFPSEFSVNVIIEKKEEIQVIFNQLGHQIEPIQLVSGNNAFEATHFVVSGMLH